MNHYHGSYIVLVVCGPLLDYIIIYRQHVIATISLYASTAQGILYSMENYASINPCTQIYLQHLNSIHNYVLIVHRYCTQHNAIKGMGKSYQLCGKYVDVFLSTLY